MKKSKLILLIVMSLLLVVGMFTTYKHNKKTEDKKVVEVKPLELHIDKQVQPKEKEVVETDIPVVEKKYIKHYVMADTLNIRKEPNLESEIVSILSYGESVEVYINGEWGELECGLYVNAAYLSQELNSETYNVPQSNGMKSYMPFAVGGKSIFSQSSDQYRLQQLCTTGNFGIRQYEGRYCVALGSYFNTSIGQYFDLILENGVVIPCIMADQKADCHTDGNNIVTTSNGCVSEFIVDSAMLDKTAKRMGDVSHCMEAWKSKVVSVKVYNMNAL